MRVIDRGVVPFGFGISVDRPLPAKARAVSIAAHQLVTGKELHLAQPLPECEQRGCGFLQFAGALVRLVLCPAAVASIVLMPERVLIGFRRGPPPKRPAAMAQIVQDGCVLCPVEQPVDDDNVRRQPAQRPRRGHFRCRRVRCVNRCRHGGDDKSASSPSQGPVSCPPIHACGN